MKRIITAIVALFIVTGCTTAGQPDAAKTVAVANQLTTLYFQRAQAQVDAMKAGPAKDAAQAKLLKAETDAELIVAVGQIVVGALPAPATQPTQNPAAN